MISSITNKRGFTLVEMLAVIAIMAVVIVAAIPAIKAVSSTGLASGARQLSNAMQLARQYAINYRVPVRLTLVTDPSATNAMTSMSNLTVTNVMFHAYSVYWESNDINNNLVAWWPLQDLRTLPPGVIFIENNTTAYNQATAPAILTAGMQVPGTFGNVTNMLVVTNIITGVANNATFSYIEFRPTGVANNIGSSSGVADVRLVQGAVGNPNTPSQTILVNDINNWVVLEYDSLVGRVRLRYPESYQ